MKNKIKLMLVLISIVIAMFIISSGFGSWQENLSVDVNVKTAEKFKKEKKKIILKNKSGNEDITADKKSTEGNVVPKDTNGNKAEASDSDKSFKESRGAEAVNTTTESTDAKSTKEDKNTSKGTVENNASLETDITGNTDSASTDMNNNTSN